MNLDGKCWGWFLGLVEDIGVSLLRVVMLLEKGYEIYLVGSVLLGFWNDYIG